jgi:hypothetical protein
MRNILRRTKLTLAIKRYFSILNTTTEVEVKEKESRGDQTHNIVVKEKYTTIVCKMMKDYSSIQERAFTQQLTGWKDYINLLI